MPWAGTNCAYEAFVLGDVPLRALWWGEVEAVGVSATHDAPPPIVLLHGLGDGADIWRPMLAAWPDDGYQRPVMALDLPGHGGSAWLPRGDYRIEKLTGIVAKAIERLRIGRPILIGHSLGARVALEAVASGGINARATILIDMSPDDRDDVDAAVAEHIDRLIGGAADRDGLIQLVKDRLPLVDDEAVHAVIGAVARQGPQGWCLPLDPGIKQLLESADGEADEWGLLRRLFGPVGIVRGAFSSALLRPTAMRMAAATPRPAPVMTIEQAGHAIPLEQPRVLASTLATLVARLVAVP